MRVIFRKATAAVLGARTAYTSFGVPFDPPASYYQGFNPLTDDSFIISDTTAPTNISSSPEQYIVDNPLSPTTVLLKYTAVPILGTSTLIADGADSTSLTINILDNTGTLVTSGSYVVKLRATLGFIVDNTVTTVAGVASTTLIAGHLTGDCLVTASANDKESVAAFNTTASMTSSLTVNNPNVINAVQTIGQYLTFTAIVAPGNPGNGFGNLYMKTGFPGLFWKPNSGGAEVDLTLGASSSGDVNGPGSSTDKAVTRFSGIGGKTIQNSTVILSDTGDFTGVGTITGAGTLTVSGAVSGDLHLISSNFFFGQAGSGITLLNTTSGSISLLDQTTTPNSSISITGGGIAIVSGTNDLVIDSSNTGTSKIILNVGTTADITFDRSATPKFTFSTDGTNDWLAIKAGYLELDDVPSVPTSAVGNGALYKKTTDGGLYWQAEGGSEVNLTTVGGGNTTGAASSTNTALVRFSGTTGKVLQDGTILENGSGGLTQVQSITGQSGSPLQITNANSIQLTATGAGNNLNMSGEQAILQDATAASTFVAASTFASVFTSGSVDITSGSGIFTQGTIASNFDNTDNLGSPSNRFASVYARTIDGGTGNLDLVAPANIGVQPTANSDINLTVSGTGNITVTAASGEIRLWNNFASSVTVQSPFTPISDGYTSLGTSLINWSAVFSRIYDSKTGQDVNFNRAGTTYLKFISSGITLSTSIVPDFDTARSLGDSTHRFVNIFVTNVLAITAPLNLSGDSVQVEGINGTYLQVGHTTGVGIGTNTPAAKLHNNGSTLFTVLPVADLPTGGDIGSAATTVDIYTSFTLNQTTAGQTITLPSPTNATAGRIVTLMNIGTQAVTFLATSMNAGQGRIAQWTGSAWFLLTP